MTRLQEVVTVEVIPPLNITNQAAVVAGTEEVMTIPQVVGTVEAVTPLPVVAAETRPLVVAAAATEGVTTIHQAEGMEEVEIPPLAVAAAMEAVETPPLEAAVVTAETTIAIPLPEEDMAVRIKVRAKVRANKVRPAVEAAMTTWSPKASGISSKRLVINSYVS